MFLREEQEELFVHCLYYNCNVYAFLDIIIEN